MINSREYIVIQQEMNRILFEKMNLIKKTWRLLLTLTIVLIVIFVFLFPNQFAQARTAWILPTFGSLAFMITLSGFLFSQVYISEKPFYEYLFKELVEKINLDDGLNLTYKSYDKEAIEFNKTGGLFTRYASINTRRHISGVTDDQFLFDIYDCMMFTSGGDSSVTHFDGVYFVLHKNVNTVLQVRTNGTPSLKGVAYKRLREFETIKIYKHKNTSITSVDGAFISFVETLRENNNYSKIFLSVVEGEIHLGLWYRRNPGRKRKDISVESIFQYYQYFRSELQLIEQLNQIDTY